MAARGFSSQPSSGYPPSGLSDLRRHPARRAAIRVRPWTDQTRRRDEESPLLFHPAPECFLENSCSVAASRSQPEGDWLPVRRRPKTIWLLHSYSRISCHYPLWLARVFALLALLHDASVERLKGTDIVRIKRGEGADFLRRDVHRSLEYKPSDAFRAGRSR
jgi:hypothetical protein